jgi:hypothetical protein
MGRIVRERRESGIPENRYFCGRDDPRLDATEPGARIRLRAPGSSTRPRGCGLASVIVS